MGHVGDRLQGDPSDWLKPPVDLVLTAGAWWAAPVATYCPDKMTEHAKSKSKGDFNPPDRSPCISPDPG